MSDTQRQIELERDSVIKGKERYFAALERDAGRGREYDNPVANRQIANAMRDLLPGIRQLQAEADTKLNAALTTGQRLSGWETPVQAMSASTLAYITLKQTVDAAGHQFRVQRVATAIGRMVTLELQWEKARADERAAAKARDYDPPNRIQQMKKHVAEVNPKSVKKWLRRLDDLEMTTLSKRDQHQVGAALLSVLFERCPYVARRETISETVRGRFQQRTILTHTEELGDALAQGHLNAAISRPWFTPMVVPPVPWSDERAGGYLVLKNSMVKSTGQYNHTLRPSDVTYRALNAIQATPWRVNVAVLMAAETALEDQIGPIPYGTPKPMPASIDKDTWERMGRDERGAHKAIREGVHTHNNRVEAKRLSLARVVGLAGDLADEPVIYFPHALDWRGRAYPLPQDLHPQGSDMTKALLTFATAKPLGRNGMRWLMCHAAGMYGLDKIDRDEQELWCRSMLREIRHLSAQPFTDESLEFWSKADKPWQFFAAAREINAAFDWEAKHDLPVEQFESSLPVSVDGSCNGLQHLSAMGLDPVGAAAVNLKPGPRQDIYSIVCVKVQEALKGTVWDDKVERKTVKRGIMTTPYGLTSIGMRDQLIKDGWCEGLAGDRMHNANILRDALREAIGDTLVKGTEIMEWMQACAAAMAEKHNTGLTWETPTGNIITQSYEHAPVVTVQCLLGRLTYADANSRKKPRTIKPQKAKLSVAPNIIHSFDASHLMLTVDLAEQQEADFSYAMVHDSFGCHAADIDLLGVCIREAFVEMYSEDQFATLMSSFIMEQPEGVAETLSTIDPPERGSFDITQVREAEWFFA